MTAALVAFTDQYTPPHKPKRRQKERIELKFVNPSLKVEDDENDEEPPAVEVLPEPNEITPPKIEIENPIQNIIPQKIEPMLEPLPHAIPLPPWEEPQKEIIIEPQPIHQIQNPLPHAIEPILQQNNIVQNIEPEPLPQAIESIPQPAQQHPSQASPLEHGTTKYTDESPFEINLLLGQLYSGTFEAKLRSIITSFDLDGFERVTSYLVRVTITSCLTHADIESKEVLQMVKHFSSIYSAPEDYQLFVQLFQNCFGWASPTFDPSPFTGESEIQNYTRRGLCDSNGVVSGSTRPIATVITFYLNFLHQDDAVKWYTNLTSRAVVQESDCFAFVFLSQVLPKIPREMYHSLLSQVKPILDEAAKLPQHGGMYIFKIKKIIRENCPDLL